MYPKNILLAFFFIAFFAPIKAQEKYLPICSVRAYRPLTQNRLTTDVRINIQFEVETSCPLNQLTVALTVNNKELSHSDAFIEPNKDKADLDYLYIRSVILAEGTNKIFLTIKCNGYSASDTFIITKISKPISPKKPNLFIWGIAPTYEDKPLEYNQADIDSIHECLVVRNERKNTDVYGAIIPFYNVNENATTFDILTHIEVLKAYKAEDILIIYFSGHGFTDANGERWWITNGYEGEVYEGRNCIRISTFCKSLNKYPCKKIIVSDACASYNEFNKGNGAKDIETISNTIAQVYSCQQGQRSREDNTLRQSVFTYVFCEGINTLKADANNDKSISLSEIEAYLQKNVPLYNNNNIKQVPYIRTNGLENEIIYTKY